MQPNQDRISAKLKDTNKPLKVAKNQQIVKAATKLFLAHGYSAVSMDNVVRESGVSKATLYAHFASKTELFAAVLDKYVTQQQISQPHIRISQTVAKNTNELSSHMLQFLRAGFDHFSNDAVVDLYRLFISEVNKFPEMFELFFGPTSSQMTTEMHEYLIKYAAFINCSSDKCFMLACQILDLLRGASLWPKLGQNPQKKCLLINKKQTIKMLHQSSMLLINTYLQ